MKTYQLSDDRVIEVKKKQLGVTMKQKDSPDKFIEFTPHRWAAFRQLFESIDSKVKEMCNDQQVQYQAHIVGGHYVSVTTGYKCVDFRKFYLPYGQNIVKPTKKGIALRLSEWSDMRRLMDKINNDHPALATTLPCYMQGDHQNQEAAFDCRECYPFL